MNSPPVSLLGLGQPPEGREDRPLEEMRQLERMDPIVLDEMKYVPFSKSGGEVSSCSGTRTGLTPSLAELTFCKVRINPTGPRHDHRAAQIG